MLPLIIGGIAAAGVVAYEVFKKPKTTTATTSKTVAYQPSAMANPALAATAAAAAANPTSAAANAVAHLTQPQPPDQPPLPPSPPSQIFESPGVRMQVTTQDTGQAGALRVRVAPSTTAAAVSGGEPATGGGIPHLAYLTTTGPENGGFVPIQYNALKGWSWAGYMTQA